MKVEILLGLEENLRFTSYRYDPVNGKHFAYARFYDDANGRMLGLVPVKRGLNGYQYCDNDPVDYVDPAGGDVSQKLRGHRVNWKKAAGEAVKGAVIGAAQEAMVASGVKIPGAVANAANFVAGTIGSAAEQGIGRGRVSIERSILGGIDNMIGNSRYGTGRLEDLKNAIVRGMKAGAANAGLGYSMAKGYQYGVSQTGFGKRKKPSLMGFVGETLRGAVTGGVTSAAFYGAGKGIEKLWSGFRANKAKEADLLWRAERARDELIVNTPGGRRKSMAIGAYDVKTEAMVADFAGPITEVVSDELVKRANKIGGIGSTGLTDRNIVGVCAEFRAANQLLLIDSRIANIRFTAPVRPRTGEVRPNCKNCLKIFSDILH